VNTLNSNAGYADEASDLLKRYESLDPVEVHTRWREWFPQAPSRILDIGAGTGRDAAWFVSLGHSVVAVEPTDELREGGQQLHREPEITWLNDAMPDLSQTHARNETFDMVMLNAVWMHLNEEERRIGMASIAALMVPGACLLMSLRHGPVPEGRRMFEVSGEETIALAKTHQLTPLLNIRSGSILGENKKRGVEWTMLVFEKS
jgi:SAM-dependent methyltransferase